MALKKINYVDKLGVGKMCQIDKEPDTCPICLQKIQPIRFLVYEKHNDNLEIVYNCPNSSCDHLFIAYYFQPSRLAGMHNYFVLSGSRLPLKIDYKEFPDVINRISKEFSKIYNQAWLAESNGLSEICGSGYRRALEFLIKDYLVSLNPENEDEIKKLWLGKAIERIDNKNIKICAERAAWLGNDETHYIRKWEDKDIENLKDLIDLTVNWIDSEARTKKYEVEMKN